MYQNIGNVSVTRMDTVLTVSLDTQLQICKHYTLMIVNYRSVSIQNVSLEFTFPTDCIKRRHNVEILIFCPNIQL